MSTGLAGPCRPQPIGCASLASEVSPHWPRRARAPHLGIRAPDVAVLAEARDATGRDREQRLDCRWARGTEGQRVGAGTKAMRWARTHPWGLARQAGASSAPMRLVTSVVVCLLPSVTLSTTVQLRREGGARHRPQGAGATQQGGRARQGLGAQVKVSRKVLQQPCCRDSSQNPPGPRTSESHQPGV